MQKRGVGDMKFRIGDIVTLSIHENAVLYRVMNICNDDWFDIIRICDEENNEPTEAAMTYYHLATDEQCRTSGLKV
jgi:hypothetical protein